MNVEHRRISNSEVTTWSTCQRRYYYAFDLGISPKRRSRPGTPIKGNSLYRGTVGHELLAIYYESLRVGESHSEALDNVRRTVSAYMFSGQHDVDIIAFLGKRLEQYFSFYADDHKKYEYLHVEKVWELPLTDQYTYVFRNDLVKKEKKPNAKIILEDHKFAYNFWPQDEINLNLQMPKYTGALRHNGIYPQDVILNQIRSRDIASTDPKDLFLRKAVNPSNAKVQQALYEQIIASERIDSWRQLPLAIREKVALRASGTYPSPCKGCVYKDPCASEYDGGDTTYLIATEFEKNPYGYNFDPNGELNNV